MLTKFLSFIFNEEIANCSYNFKNLRILDSSEIKNTSTYIMTDRKAKLLPIFMLYCKKSVDLNPITNFLTSSVI